MDLQLIRVICKIWSNFLNVVLFFCKAIFAAFLFGNAKLQNGSYISVCQVQFGRALCEQLSCMSEDHRTHTSGTSSIVMV